MIHIALGGFLGAITRYGISQLVRSIFNTSYPIATFFINCFGSFLIGIIIGEGFSTSAHLFAVVGFLGAFTTFSTFSFEVIQLVEKKEMKKALFYLMSSVLVCVLLAYIGFQIGH